MTRTMYFFLFLRLLCFTPYHGRYYAGSRRASGRAGTNCAAGQRCKPAPLLPSILATHLPFKKHRNSSRCFYFCTKGGDSVGLEQLVTEYEDDLQRVRDKIQRMKLQESALHLAGQHNDAWKLAGLRVQYELIERDLAYSLAEMSKTQKGGAGHSEDETPRRTTAKI